MGVRRSVKQYDDVIMKRIGELQEARLHFSSYSEIDSKLDAQINILYDIWHEVTHEERLIEPAKKKVNLIEGTFQDHYIIQTNVNHIHFESSSLHTVKEVEEKGFEITHIKDR